MFSGGAAVKLVTSPYRALAEKLEGCIEGEQYDIATWNPEEAERILAGFVQPIQDRMERLDAALRVLANPYYHDGLCWCGMAIGDPHYREHSSQCKQARQALATVQR